MQVIDLKKIMGLIEELRDGAEQGFKDGSDVAPELLVGREGDADQPIKVGTIPNDLVQHLINTGPRLNGIKNFAAHVLDNKIPEIIEANKSTGFEPNFLIFFGETWVSVIEPTGTEKLKKMIPPSEDPNRQEALMFIIYTKGNSHNVVYKITRDENNNAILDKEPAGGPNSMQETLDPSQVRKDPEGLLRERPKMH